MIIKAKVRMINQPVPAQCICHWCEQLAVMVREWRTDAMPCSSFSYACADHADRLQPPTPTPVDVYTVQPGRHIYRNGEAFIRIDLAGWPGKGANPSEGDDMAYVIAAMLNIRQPKPGDRS